MDNPDNADWVPILRRLETAASQSPDSALSRCEYRKGLYRARVWPGPPDLRSRKACVRLDPNSIEGH